MLYSKSGFPGAQWLKNPPANAGDTGNVYSIPRLGGSPGVRNGNPLHYSCLENSMDRETWRATVHGVAKSWTRLCMHAHYTVGSYCLSILHVKLTSANPNFPGHHSFSPLLLRNHQLVLYVCDPVPFSKTDLFVSYFRFPHIMDIVYYLSLSDWLHLMQ